MAYWGQKIRARVALANYSTFKVEGTVRVWFSNDLILSEDDIASPSQLSLSMHPGATRLDLTVTVPAGAPIMTTFVIFEIVGKAGPYKVSDWIPARGTLIRFPGF